MKYFNAFQTEQQIKLRYHQLARENHPDKGGDAAVMQEINKQYADIKAMKKFLAGQGPPRPWFEMNDTEAVVDEFLQTPMGKILIDFGTSFVVGYFAYRFFKR